MTNTTATITPDYETIKKNQRTAWETGDYPRVGNTLQLIAELLAESADIRPDQRVLDVACGQGNAAIAAALRFAEATGVDFAVNLLEQGRERAAAERVPVTFLEGDAEALPLPDASFDAVLSTVGVMFAPDQERAASELVRVTRPGGTIALASWTPDSMVGDMFRCIGRWAPPPAGVRPPMLWGDENHLRGLFGNRVDWTLVVLRQFVFRYRSAEHFSEWFRTNYGPITRLAGSLAAEEESRFAAELADVARTFDRGAGAGLIAPSQYLEAVGVVRG